MNIEKEIFKKSKLDIEKAVSYGFVLDGSTYKYCKRFMDDEFDAIICFEKNGEINGKVIEVESGEEYDNFRRESILGEYSNIVKEEYQSILYDIVNNCCLKDYFVFGQANRIARTIEESYGIVPEFLWDKFPSYGVFRNKRSGKWFGIIINVDKSKILKKGSGEIEVLNIKLDDLTDVYLRKKGIFPSYHMSKKSWVSIILDDTLKDEEVMELIEISYGFSNTVGEWIVPANPKYYDVVEAFEKDDAVLWKQSNNILVGDTIYIYMGRPISAILYKCEVLEVDIPYEYKDENLSMKKVMKIKRVKKYNEEKFPFNKLVELGVKAIRGPRSVPKDLSKLLNEEVK